MGQKTFMSHLPPLKDDELRELIKKAQAGDEVAKQKAKDKIVCSNLLLVYSLVQRFNGRGYDWDDLVQIGIIGLLKAIENFDLSYKNCFSTYAVPLIIGEIRRSLRDDSPIHVSRSLKDLNYQAHLAQEEFRKKHDKDPSVKKLAGILQVKTEELTMALEAGQRPASLQSPLKGDDSQKLCLGDTVVAKDGEDIWLESLQLREGLANLPERLKYIMACRFFKEESQSEVAAKLGISQVQVCRLEKQAIMLLKKYMIS
ncbi:MAG: SigB/SigF/SigG family RNA polymerase sigma factor [Clostridia bacterium]|nr:SigB/SigF/SigG family RNA polymerase sigma factor [Clostridia bacterium]